MVFAIWEEPMLVKITDVISRHCDAVPFYSKGIDKGVYLSLVLGLETYQFMISFNS